MYENLFLNGKTLFFVYQQGKPKNCSKQNVVRERKRKRKHSLLVLAHPRPSRHTNNSSKLALFAQSRVNIVYNGHSIYLTFLSKKYIFVQWKSQQGRFPIPYQNFSE